MIHTAIRETKEEIGIDLSDRNNFRLIGRLDDRLLRTANEQQNLTVSVFGQYRVVLHVAIWSLLIHFLHADSLLQCFVKSSLRISRFP